MIRIETFMSDVSHAVAIERLGPAISTRVLWRAKTSGCKIALTFDDGPHPAYTPDILQVLADLQVPATFFLIGRNIEKHPELVAATVAAGHELANHTFSHPVLWQLADRDIAAEINQTDRLIRAIIGRKPRFFRPPMGLFSPRVLDLVEQTGYRAVIGDVYPRDPHLPGADKIVHRVARRTRPGSIIILHDGGNGALVDRSQTVSALRVLIPRLIQRGLQFVRLSELFPEDIAE